MVKTRLYFIAMKGRIIHRRKHDAKFALMNSAPAELLHPLTYAALQPSLATLSTHNAGSAKKTPAIKPALEYCRKKTNAFSKENAASPESVRGSGANRQDRFGLLLSIQLAIAFLFLQSHFVQHSLCHPLSACGP